MIPVPRQMVTDVPGESVTFVINQTSAFFLRGAVNHDHKAKFVTLTPLSNPSQAKSIIINDYSSLLDFSQILYWESGLDREENYSVQITQLGDPGVSASFSFNVLDIIDRYVIGRLRPMLTSCLNGSCRSGAPPGTSSGDGSPNQSNQSDGSPPSTSGHFGLSAGVIAAIAVNHASYLFAQEPRLKSF